MSGHSLAATLNRLNGCHEAADLIYSKDAARMLVDTGDAAGSGDNLSIVVARRIGTMVARLNDLASPASQIVLTPRMVLCELMDIVRQAIYTSLPTSMQQEVAPTDKAGVVRQFNAYASTRKIPLEAAAESLYTVAYVSVKLRIELVALQLRRRIQEELQKKDTQASESSVAALVVTETLLEDFMTIYNNIVLTLPITKAATAVSGSNDRHGEYDGGSSAVAAAERLVPVFVQYFYQLCDWALVLESTMKGPVMSYTQVKRLSVNEERGTVVVDLHRPTPQTAWGLLLNEQGCLVDIDVSLRVFEKAKQLHHLLQATPQGAHITKINDQSIPPVRQGDYAAYAQRVLTTLQTATATRKNVQLSLQSSAFKAAARTLPTEVAFVAPPQGGEGTSGQRVTLVLRRQSTTTDWGFAVDERLYWRPPPTRLLSEPAREFMKDYSRQLRLLAVNGVEALHATQVGLLVESTETVVLELLVMPSFAATEEARGRTSHPRDEAVISGEKGDADKVKESAGKPKTPSVTRTTKNTAAETSSAADSAKVEAAVAQFVQRHTETPAAAATQVAMETPLVDAVMARPSPTAAAAKVAAVSGTAESADAAADAEEGELKRKRSRPRKTGTKGAKDTGDAVKPNADTGVVPTSFAEEDKAASTAGTIEKSKERKGRSRKDAAAGEAAAALELTEDTAAETAGDGVPERASHHQRSPVDVNDAAVHNILAKFADGNDDAKPCKKRASVAKKNSSTKVPIVKKKGTEEAGEALEQEKEAACVFDNKVRLLRLTDEEMVLERPSASTPWGLPIGRMADTTESPQQLPLRLMSLPPAKSAAAKTHPFLVRFKKAPSTWFIAEVNGTPAANAEATLKSIAKLTRMTLRFLRK
jgi:hypothetical protein